MKKQYICSLTTLKQIYMFLQNPRILIVDDEHPIRNALRAILEPHSPHIFEAADGLACFDLTNKQHFDVIFMNIKMPRVDGEEVLQRLPKMGCHSKVVIVSGIIRDQEHIEYLKKEGAFEVLRKPPDIDILLKTLYNALTAIYREALLMPN